MILLFALFRNFALLFPEIFELNVRVEFTLYPNGIIFNIFRIPFINKLIVV